MKRDFQLFKEEIKGKKVAVVGIGVSNMPLIEFLLRLGACVTAFDKRTMQRLDPQVESFKDRVEFSLGDDYLENLTGFDYVFRTPGMRPDNEFLLRAREEGSIITSEMREFIRHCKGHTIGITGSDGKSTTTTLTHEILLADGKKSWIGGNIGFPLFDKVEEITEEDYVVLELSSFQLMDMDVSTDIAVVTNLSPNHLDIHKDMEEYTEAKRNIYLHQDRTGILVINQDNDMTSGFRVSAPGKVLSFSSSHDADAHMEGDRIMLGDREIISRKDMRIRGVHNAENLMAAALALKDICSIESMREVAEKFPGVKHRNQYIRDIKGASFYNDSIASSPTRTLATVKSFEDKKRRINIVLGGYDKNLDYDVLFEEGIDFLKSVVLYGAAAPKIEKSLEKFNKDGRVAVHHGKDFKDTVDILIDISQPEDVSILSPACASFDMFRNFEDRGDTFRRLIEEHR